MANDFYKTLGVKENASADEIKRAYRRLAREHHPDLHPGDKQAEKRFKEVQAAYEVLGDANKRQQYDRFGHAAFDPGFAGAGAVGPRPGSRGGWSRSHRNEGGGFRFDDIFGEFFGGGRQAGHDRRSYGPPPSTDVETEVAIPLRLALLGGETEIAFTYPATVDSPNRSTERLSVTIPPGVDSGTRIRLAGKGTPTGPNRGDLFVTLRIEPDPVFTRDGLDVQSDVPVSIAEAILGASVDVPTLEGVVTLTIPPCTSGGKRLRLRGKGGKDRQGNRGDHYVRVRLVVPAEVDDEGRRLIEQFDRRHPVRPRP